MIKLNIKINTLDDIFQSMEIFKSGGSADGTRYTNSKGETTHRPAQVYFKWVHVGNGPYRNHLIFGRLHPEVQQEVEKFCCEGRAAAARAVLQRNGAEPVEYGIISTDKHGIANICIGYVAQAGMTFKGVDMLRDDLPLGPIGVSND